MDITQEVIDLEFPADCHERGVHNFEFVLQQMHTALRFSRVVSLMTLSPTRGKNPLEA